MRKAIQYFVSVIMVCAAFWAGRQFGFSLLGILIVAGAALVVNLIMTTVLGRTSERT